MAILSPAENTLYCDGSSGARLEYQTPDRNLAEENYPWTGHSFTSGDVPIRYTVTKTRAVFPVDSFTITPGDTETTSALTLNQWYLIEVSGDISLGLGDLFDACYQVIDGGTPTPHSRLRVVNDSGYERMFFRAASQGTVIYDGTSHTYELPYGGKGEAIGFSLQDEGIGTLQIRIYTVTYTLTIEDENGATLFTETRGRPYENVNIACGGECPSRTSFSCDCDGVRSCYEDDGAGNITKIFEATLNP